MGIKSIALVASTLVLSTSANAATISYSGFSLDTETNIVTGAGLEWLQWDETNGLSSNNALAAYAEDGWRIASRNEAAILLNSFSFGMTFSGTTTQTQKSIVPYDPSEGSDFKKFGELFGITNTGTTNTSPSDPSERTQAWFIGADAAEAEYRAYGYIGVADDFAQNSNTAPFVSHAATLSSSGFNGDVGNDGSGVALVRGDTLPISTVPVPAAVWLFGTGLIGLIGVARRKKA